MWIIVYSYKKNNYLNRQIQKINTVLKLPIVLKALQAVLNTCFAGHYNKCCAVLF